MGWGAMIGSLVDSNVNTNTQQNATVTSKKNISQEGINKIIYDILSSDSGLAALSSGESGSGGFGSSTRGLLAQDMMVKLAGEIANITAESTQTTVGSNEADKQSPMGKALGTIICTELLAQGLLRKRMYVLGMTHFDNMNEATKLGYIFWAEPMVALMKRSKLVSRFWAPIMNGRYEMVVNKKFTFGWFFTHYILEPISFLIGSILLGVSYGRYAL